MMGFNHEKISTHSYLMFFLFKSDYQGYSLDLGVCHPIEGMIVAKPIEYMKRTTYTHFEKFLKGINYDFRDSNKINKITENRIFYHDCIENLVKTKGEL